MKKTFRLIDVSSRKREDIQPELQISIALTLRLIYSDSRNEEYFFGYFQIFDIIHITFRLIYAS